MRTRTIVAIALLLTLIAVPSYSDYTGILTAQVTSDGVYKYDSYTITHFAFFDSLIVLMPEIGARSVISFTSSKHGWWSGYSFRGDDSLWGISSRADSSDILYDETATFTLVTAASVPTAESFTPESFDCNWTFNTRYYYGVGWFTVPVPDAPEPSSLAAILAGLAGFGALLTRRR